MFSRQSLLIFTLAPIALALLARAPRAEAEYRAFELVITNETTGATFRAQPFPPFIKDIIEAGGLVESAKSKMDS